MKPDIRAFLDDYLGELIEGNAAIFAGAGLSVPAGYVDWRELLRPLANELGLEISLESDLVALAQFHVNASGANRHKLHKAVIEALSPENPPTKNHELLARLPIRTWWTTNYDKLVEDALRQAGKVVDVKSAVPQLATTRPGRDATVYKMHGDVDRPDEAVATKDDFECYQRDRAAFITALAGDLVSKTFLFLGFSFTDPNLEHVLSRVRLTFTTNQRRHFAVFRRRTREAGESEVAFEHSKTRQALVAEDLKRFNVRVLLVDDYAEITEFLTELVSRFRSHTAFVSASAFDYEPWGRQAVVAFAQNLGRALIADGTRIASGLGSGIGDALLAGALEEIMKSRGHIEDALVLRPFPQSAESKVKTSIWPRYRREIIAHAGVAIFLFGNKDKNGKVLHADGMTQEFDIAIEQGAAVVPVGATGGTAKVLSERVLADPSRYAPRLGKDEIALVRKLAEPTGRLDELLDPLRAVIRHLQRGSAP